MKWLSGYMCKLSTTWMNFRFRLRSHMIHIHKNIIFGKIWSQKHQRVPDTAAVLTFRGETPHWPLSHSIGTCPSRGLFPIQWFTSACFLSFFLLLFVFSPNITSLLLFGNSTQCTMVTLSSHPSPSQKKNKERENTPSPICVACRHWSTISAADSQLRKQDSKGFCLSLPNKKKLSRQESIEESS